MKFFTNLLLLTLNCVFLSTSLFSSNITILESQSIHPLHKMDNNWKTIATGIGHTATIVGQDFLDDYSNLSNTDVLIISSGLIDISDSRKATVLEFVMNGGNAYIQSEYLVDLSGNETFKYVAENLGSTFSWEGEVTGNLNPMEITGEMANNLSDGNEISYYWYGTHGTGDENFIPFLSYNNKNWGFIFCPTDITHGKMVTTSDQDWIRTLNKNGLMENILSFLSINNNLSTLPTVSIDLTSQPCDDTHSFAATIDNSVPSLEVQWLLNGQIIANENGLTYSSSNLVDGDVVECRISMTNSCASYDHVSNPILIAPVYPAATPELSITVDNDSFCEGQTATFNTTTTQIADVISMSYQWLINGNPVTDATNETFVSDFLNDQDIVSCLLTYDDNCDSGMEVFSNELSISIMTQLNPTIAIAADFTEICIGELVTFSATGLELGTNPTFQWQVDGNNVGNNTPTFSSANITNGQNVNCIITIQDLCSTTDEATSNTISIIVNEMVNPSIEITTSTDAICSGEMVTIIANATDFGTQPAYQWQIDGLNVGTNQSEFSTTALEDGQQITCILSVVESCANSAAVTSEPISFSVSQGSVPTLSIVSTSSIICSGQSTTFTAGGDNHGDNPSYEWFVNGVSVGNNATELILDNITNTQEVSCTMMNTAACPNFSSANSNVVTVEVTSIEIEVLELVSENCNNADGLIEVFANGGNAPYTYEWSNGLNASMITDIVAGEYTLIATDVNGCSAATTIEIINNEGPQISAVNISATDCEGDNGQAEVVLENPTDDLTIEWFNADKELISTFAQAQDLIPGTYEIVVTNDYGCEAIETVIIEQISAVAVAVNNHLKVDLGSAIQLESVVNTTSEITYEWFPLNGLSCTDCPNPTANIATSQSYTLIVTNESGCTASDEVFVQVVPKDDLFIPNAFSPNGDGINDNFTVFAGDNVAQIKTLRIFDRWGAEVFNNQNFSPNNEQEGWSGIYKGEMMKVGVFVFYVEVEYIDGSVKIKKGDLSIAK